MDTKSSKKYSYIVFLAVSFFVVADAWRLGNIDLKDKTPAPFISGEASSETVPIINDTSEEESTLTTDASETPDENADSEVSSFFTADRSYFDDALFIGDSRTVGLYEYGDLGNALVLADSGMNVYKVFHRSFKLPSGEEKTLEEILAEQQFGKIYVMLGINELGYDFEQTVKVYQDMIKQIEALQPDAIIYLQANLHITAKKSEKSDIYTNENINRFNLEVQQMADSKTRFFLDANELFDDEEGNLSVEYTVDEAHILGKYYVDWVDWILCHCVTQNPLPHLLS